MKKMENGILLADIVSVADREPGDIERLAKSIREVGLLQPILLRLRDDGKFEVVDGRRRFCAIVKLRWEALPPGSYALCETKEDSDGSERRDAAPRGEAKKEPTVKEREEALAQKRNKRALELLADYLLRRYNGKAWAEAVPEGQKLVHLLNTVRLYGYTGDFTYDSRCRLTREKVIPATDRLFEAVYDHARGRLVQNLMAEARRAIADISREAGDAVAELCCIIPKWQLEIKRQAAVENPGAESARRAAGEREGEEVMHPIFGAALEKCAEEMGKACGKQVILIKVDQSEDWKYCITTVSATFVITEEAKK